MPSLPAAIRRLPAALGRLPAGILAFFTRLATLLALPHRALSDAATGRWNAVRDGVLLLLFGSVVAYAPEAARVALAGWDLGPREALNELSWTLGRRLTPDFLVLLPILVVVVLPLRVTRRLPFDRALALAIAARIPAFLVRLGGAVWRLHTARPHVWLFEGPEWWIGLTWSGLLLVLCLTVALRDADA